jgi:uncharacterized protein YjbI with pentapeptide repeats
MRTKKMTNEGHVVLLRASVAEWNDWRLKNSRIIPDLSHADLSEKVLRGAYLYRANLAGANLSGADLAGANLNHANLFRAEAGEADFSGASLVKANLSQAELIRANFHQADLSEGTLVRANLSGANLSGANLRAANLGQASLFRANLSRATLNHASLFKADLSEADLGEASLIGTNFHGATLDRARLVRANLTNANLYSALLVRADLEEAILTNCSVYGASACNVNLAGSRQRDLDIMPVDQPPVAVGDLEAAQLLCLLLHHDRVRELIETIALKTVLIIGRFPPERRPVLEAIEDGLRRRGYSPVVMDFDAPGSRNMTEAVKILGRMSKFIIADLTGDPAIPEILDAVVHHIPAVPILPIEESDGAVRPAAHHYQK